jgi:hypothetical protein
LTAEIVSTDNTINIVFGGKVELALALLPAPGPTGDVVVTVRYQHFTATAKGNHMSYQLPNDKLIVVKVSYVDAKGNPASVDGDVVWDTSNNSVATIEPDQLDSAQCKIIAGGLGTAQVSATADADLGDGVREIVTTLDVTVIAGEAVAGTISPVGEAQPQAPHPELQK